MVDIDDAETLEHLRAALEASGVDEVRAALLERFFELVEYRNAVEWNRLVRTCEALRMIGWGNHEPVDARASKWLNGRLYTELKNRTFETRYLSAGWSKRGDTFVLDPTHRYFYPSPDLPEREELDTHAYQELHPTVDETDYGIEELATQRNFLARNPIRLQKSGNAFDIFQPFIDELLVLKKRLDREMRPERYGDGFDYVGLTYQFSNVWGVYFHGDIPAQAHERFEQSKIGHYRPFDRPRLKIGRMSTARGQVRLIVDRHVDEAFADAPLADQKAAFVEDVLAVLDVLEKRLARRDGDFDVAAVRQDFLAVASDWT